MEIVFATAKLSKLCNSLKSAQQRWGTECGTILLRRLDEMRASENLRILMTLPQAGCHPLKGNRHGQWAVSLKHPRRLVFEPANDPLPQLEDGGVDTGEVTVVRIMEVVDYHD